MQSLRWLIAANYQRSHSLLRMHPAATHASSPALSHLSDSQWKLIYRLVPAVVLRKACKKSAMSPKCWALGMSDPQVLGLESLLTL